MPPPRIVICRHAESIEDVDNSIYDAMSDLEIPLTRKGEDDCVGLAAELGRVLGPEANVIIFSSPGCRNIQTLNVILPRLPAKWRIVVVKEPLIVKQDWGCITAENRPGIEEDRYKTGVLRYTFPTGESAASMIRRLASFRDKLIALQQHDGGDVIVLSHGFEFRVLLMLFLGWSEEEFESYSNLSNCEYRVLTRTTAGEYVLDRPLPKHGKPITRLLKK